MKCCPDQVFKFNGPVIFVSNTSVGGVKDNAFLSRLQIVYADCFVQDGPLSEVATVKKEVLSEEVLDTSYISVSSTSFVSE